MSSINDSVAGLCEVNGFRPWELFNLNEDSFVVDLGSYQGGFSRYILDTYNCRVDAYDPGGESNITHPKFTFIQRPVFDGSEVLYKNTGSGSDIFAEAGEAFTSVDIREITKEHIDLMKVNVEGAELVILGLADLDNVDQIVVEFHLFRALEKELEGEYISKVVNRIMAFGYKMHQINDAPAYMFYGKH